MHGKKSKSQSRTNWGNKKNRIRIEYDDDENGWRRFDKRRKSEKKRQDDCEESEDRRCEDEEIQ